MWRCARPASCWGGGSGGDSISGTQCSRLAQHLANWLILSVESDDAANAFEFDEPGPCVPIPRRWPSTSRSNFRPAPRPPQRVPGTSVPPIKPSVPLRLSTKRAAMPTYSGGQLQRHAAAVKGHIGPQETLLSICVPERAPRIPIQLITLRGKRGYGLASSLQVPDGTCAALSPTARAATERSIL